jgi:translation initiation factor IF-3
VFLSIRRKSGRFKKPRTFQPRFDRNTFIRAPKLRVIGSDGENLGVIDKETALAKAREQELDLVLVNPQIDPPVARIISWSKFKYDLSKKQKSNKGKSGELKEMWFKPFIDTGDLEHKVSRIQEFLDKGNKVKITVRFKRGADRDKMSETMGRIKEAVGKFADIEGEVKKEGRNLSIYAIPNK